MTTLEQQLEASNARGKLALFIDLGSCFWQCWHSSANEEISAAHDRTMSMIRRIVGRGNADYVAICCDSPRSFRKEKYPDYKANRPEKDRAAIEQLRRTKETLRADGLLLWECDGYEADDIIATATHKAAVLGMRVLIVSSDKDLAQLSATSTTLYSPKADTVMDVATVRTKFGVEPEQLRDWLALVGDSSDNIRGVEGVGPKTAAGLLTLYGDIMGITRAWQANPQGFSKPAICKAFAEAVQSGALKAAVELVTLSTGAPIEFGELFEQREMQKLTEDTELTEELSSIGDEEEPEDMDRVLPPAGQSQPEPKSEPRAVHASELTIDGPRREETQQQAIVSAQPTSFELALQPGSIGAAYKLAKGLYESRLYSKFSNVEAIWAIIMRGREMGLTALAALDNFHMVEGKPAPSAHLIIARAKAHPDCEYFAFVGGDSTYAEYETKNRTSKAPTRHRYTIEDAKRAGLVKPPAPGKQEGQWLRRPAEMLRKTCAVQLARIEFPEAAQGLYCAEELEGAA